jgi:hypothetical protein
MVDSGVEEGTPESVGMTPVETGYESVLFGLEGVG